MFINEYNVGMAKFKQLPIDKKVILVMYSHLYQFESDIFISLIFKDYESSSSEYYLSLVPLKAISAFPLGTIFKEQKIHNEKSESRVVNNITINLEEKKYESFKFSELKSFFKYIKENIPDKIGKYYGQHKSIGEQRFFIFEDSFNSIKVLIPHYEIARWYYFKSSSLTRQLLSMNLEGLYKEASYLDDEEKKGKIILNFGASNADAPEIFRFAKNPFSKIMFDSFFLDLSQSIQEKETFKKMTLNTNIPIFGEINIKGKGFFIDKRKEYFFINQIIEEDSDYPFQELDIYREKKSKSSGARKVSRKVKERKNDEVLITNTTPNSAWTSVNITKNESYFVREMRKGLDDKLIRHNPLIKTDEESETIEESEIIIDEFDSELSFLTSSTNGESDTIKANMQDYYETEEHREVFRLEAFIDMMDIIINEHNCQFEVSNLLNLPQKPKNDKSRTTYKKAFLEDGITKRKYVYYNLEFEGYKFTIIEVEIDEVLKSASTLFILNSSFLEKYKIFLIMEDFTRNYGNWLKNKGYEESSYEIDFYHETLKHKEFQILDGNKFETRTREDQLLDWSKRVVNKLKKIIKVNEEVDAKI